MSLIWISGVIPLSASLGKRLDFSGAGEGSAPIGSSSQAALPTSTRDLQRQVFARNKNRRFGVLDAVRSRKESECKGSPKSALPTAVEGNSSPLSEETDFHDEGQSRQTSKKSRRIEDEAEVSCNSLKQTEADV